MKLDHQLTLHIKTNSRWLKDLTISCDTIKVLEENIGKNTSDIPCGNIFIDISPRARDIKEGINKWDVMRIKNNLSARLKKTSAKRKGNQPYGKYICK